MTMFESVTSGSWGFPFSLPGGTCSSASRRTRRRALKALYPQSWATPDTQYSRHPQPPDHDSESSSDSDNDAEAADPSRYTQATLGMPSKSASGSSHRNTTNNSETTFDHWSAPDDPLLDEFLKRRKAYPNEKDKAKAKVNAKAKTKDKPRRRNTATASSSAATNNTVKGWSPLASHREDTIISFPAFPTTEQHSGSSGATGFLAPLKRVLSMG